MLLSILVPMENRHAFHPWLAWNLRKQAVYDAGGVGAEILVCCPQDEFEAFAEALLLGTDEPGYGDGQLALRHIPSELGEGVAVKRNKLLDAARGDYIGWMDSDDWHAPDRFAVALEMLAGVPGGEEFRDRAVGFSGARYLDITSEDGIVTEWSSARWCCLPVWRAPEVVPVTIVARRVDPYDLEPLPRFDEAKKHGSDTRWMGALKERMRIAPFSERVAPVRFFALYHGGNMSRHVGGFRYDRPLADLIELCGAGWNDTTTHLQQLYRRLKKQRKED